MFYINTTSANVTKTANREDINRRSDVTTEEYNNAKRYDINWNRLEAQRKEMVRNATLPVGTKITCTVWAAAEWRNEWYYKTCEATVTKHHADGTLNIKYTRNGKSETIRCYAALSEYSSRHLELCEWGRKGFRKRSWCEVNRRELPTNDLQPATPTATQLELFA